MVQTCELTLQPLQLTLQTRELSLQACYLTLWTCEFPLQTCELTLQTCEFAGARRRTAQAAEHGRDARSTQAGTGPGYYYKLNEFVISYSISYK
jgi:hypothetical protein